MTLKRIIPILLLKNGILMRSEMFKYHQAIGDPIPTIKRLSDWNADEIVLLNIGTTENHDSRREDKYHNLGKSSFCDIIREASKFCHCPLTVGGGIKNIDDIDSLFHEGADKIVANSAFYDNPEAIKIAAEKYGSQSITASIDLNREGDN